jgi:glycosyltransferase involved in cell wall biosynthesis
MGKFFSIIIITRNRAAIIGNVLQTICALDFPRELFELIVVDNGSTDGTSGRVDSILRLSGITLKIIPEPVAGMCSARNAGIRHADGEWVIFLDDDALVPANWLDAYRQAIAVYPDAAALGGPATLDVRLPRPWWWCKKFDVSMSCQDYGEQLMPYKENTHPYGLNMVFERHTLERYCGFDTELDRLIPGLADETDLFFKMMKNNELLIYVPTARVIHSVLPDRLQWRVFRKRCIHVGRTFACLEVRHNLRLHRSLARRMISAVLDFMRYPTPAVFAKEFLEWYGYKRFDSNKLLQTQLEQQGKIKRKHPG